MHYLLLKVSKTAEECCNLIAETEPTKDLMQLLCPIVETVEFPCVLAAIKMLNIVSASLSSFMMHLNHIR